LVGITAESFDIFTGVVGDLPCGDIEQNLEQQVREIDRQVAELMLLRGELTDILQGWSISPQKPTAAIYPIRVFAKVGLTVLHLMRSFASLRMTHSVLGFRKRSILKSQDYKYYR